MAKHSFWVLEVIIMSRKQADGKKRAKKKEAIIKMGMRRVIAWADMQMQLKVDGVCMIQCSGLGF